MCMCVRVHNYGYGIDLCSSCVIGPIHLQFILIANTFPLHIRHSKHSYIFLHVIFVFRAVSQSYSANDPLVLGISVMK